MKMCIALLVKIFSAQMQDHIGKGAVCYVKDSGCYCDMFCDV